MAVFDNNGRKKTTHFGAKGMDDYTITHDANQRDRYRARQGSRCPTHCNWFHGLYPHVQFRQAMDIEPRLTVRCHT